MARLRAAVLCQVFSVIGFVLTFSSITSCQERTLVAKINPGCSPTRCNDSVVEMVYVRADGPNDTLHYLWAFHEKPCVLLALTSREANISVSWNKFPSESNSIEFTSEPMYSFGLLISEIYEFNDVNDTGFLDMSINNESYIQKIKMPDLWKMKTFQQNRDSVRLVMIGSWHSNQSFVKQGNISIELETFRMEGHSQTLPHLLHSSNATQIDVGLLNLVSQSGFDKSRYALELVMAANETSNNTVIPNSFKSLDDEHNPGVFTLVDLKTSASKERGAGGYVQWRPVAYVADDRDIINSTEMALYLVRNVTDSSSSCGNTLFAAYFGTMLENSLLKAVNISFGAKDDNFYAKNNVTFWTATVGYGFPPDEGFSMIVILVMSIGLGLPALLIVLSCFYVAIRRITHRKDDLFLGR